MNIEGKKRQESKLHESTITANENSTLNIKVNEDPNKDNFSILYNNSIVNNNTPMISSYSMNYSIKNNATRGYDQNIINSKNYNVTTRYDQSLINSIINLQKTENVSSAHDQIQNRLHYFSTDCNLINAIKIEPKITVKLYQDKDNIDIQNNASKSPNRKDLFLEKVNAINIFLTGIKKENNLDKVETEVSIYVPKMLLKHNSKRINFNVNINKKQKFPLNSTPNILKKFSRNRLSKSFEKLKEIAITKINLNKSDLIAEKTVNYTSNIEISSHKNVIKTASNNNIVNVYSSYIGNQRALPTKKKTSEDTTNQNKSPESRISTKIVEKQKSQKYIEKSKKKFSRQCTTKYSSSKGKKEEIQLKSKTPNRVNKDLDKKINNPNKILPETNLKIALNKPNNKNLKFQINSQNQMKNVRTNSILSEKAIKTSI